MKLLFYLTIIIFTVKTCEDHKDSNYNFNHDFPTTHSKEYNTAIANSDESNEQNREFKCPFMKKMKDRLRAVEFMAKNHDKLKEIQNKFSQLKHKTILDEGKVNEKYKLKSNLTKTKEKHEELHQTITELHTNLPDKIEKHTNVAVLNVKDKHKNILKEVQDLHNTLLDDFDQYEAAERKTSEEFIALNEVEDILSNKVGDLIEKIEDLKHKVEHMDSTHHDDQIIIGSNHELTLAAIEQHLDELEKLFIYLNEERIYKFKDRFDNAHYHNNIRISILDKMLSYEEAYKKMKEKHAKELEQIMNNIDINDGVTVNKLISRIQENLQSILSASE